MPSLGKGQLLSTGNTEENSASAGLKDSGELGRCIQDSLLCPVNYPSPRSECCSFPVRAPTVMHKTCQGCTSNLLCSSSTVSVLLSWWVFFGGVGNWGEGGILVSGM